MTGWSTARSACCASSIRSARFLHWIDEGDAADLRFIGDGKAARWALEALEGVDVVVQPDEPRWKRLLVADMDSTIIGQECIDELADYAGLKDEVARITERAMQGELDFAGALRERVRLLAGLDERAIGRCLDERVEVTAGAETLVQTMRAGGASCLLVSGGFLSFAEPVARRRRLRPGQGQPPGLRRRQAERRGRRPDRRCHGQARGADRSARRSSGWNARTCSRSVTAPTTS